MAEQGTDSASTSIECKSYSPPIGLFDRWKSRGEICLYRRILHFDPQSREASFKTSRLDRYSIMWLFINRLVYEMQHQYHSATSAFAAPEADTEGLDLVFSALADPVRRAILDRLDGRELLVSELAAPFAISLQAVSKHIQVLVKAGLVKQERSGRISRCRLEAGPIYQAAVWINRYAKYWQKQFDLLAVVLEDMEQERARKTATGSKRKHRKRAPGKRR